MEFARVLLPVFAVLFSACQAPAVFVPLAEVESAEIIVAVPVSDGVPTLSRARLLFPKLEATPASELSVEPGESLVLVPLDDAAFARGFVGLPRYDPRRTMLHAGGGLDCGRRGQELAFNPDDTTQIRQPLRRFEPKLLVVEPSLDQARVTALNEFPEIGFIELEFPADAENCRGTRPLELVRLQDELIFGDGIIENGTAVPASFYAVLIDIATIGSDRIILTSPRALFAVRPDTRFEASMDAWYPISAAALPVGDREDWVFEHTIVLGTQDPNTHRVFALAERWSESLEESNGWAIVEATFDGSRFGPPVVRVLREDQTSSVFQHLEDNSLLVAGSLGFIARAVPPHESFEFLEALQRDIVALMSTENPTAPHVLSFRRGFLGVGDLTRPAEFAIAQLRSGTHAGYLALSRHDDGTRLYSGWDDGEVFHSRLGEPLKLEPSELSLPHRLSGSNCAEANPTACGRVRAAKATTGLSVVEGEDERDLLLATFEGCTGLVVHDIPTGCSTSLEFPGQPPSAAFLPRLRKQGNRIWVSDGAGKLHEVRFPPAP